ncbi:hypothetical protein B5X24_HaOG206828 [Helicoverpa armigera]|uniref:Uncharacterized protein n=1 Tax=Helicoverpa armigera TaxID=29058 RepID=A0A2W1BTE7_HELAM|nr:hypothetical protein B5X24_HaOG206828 [Helicoverpa armigera]
MWSQWSRASGRRAASRAERTKNPLRHKNTRRQNETDPCTRAGQHLLRICVRSSRSPRASRTYRDSTRIPRFDLKLRRMRPSIYHMAFDRSPETRRPVTFEKRRAS